MMKTFIIRKLKTVYRYDFLFNEFFKFGSKTVVNVRTIARQTSVPDDEALVFREVVLDEIRGV